MKPYPDQIKAVESAIKYHRGIIAMPTGTGKSFVIKLIVKALNLKALIIVPSLEIKKQLSAELKNTKAVVKNIDDTSLKNDTNYDVLIIDEGHHTAARTYQKLNKTAWNNIYYRFFMTATPFRNDTEETLLFEAICGRLIFKLSYLDAVKKGYIAPVDAYVLNIPKKTTEGYTYREVYNDLVVNNNERNMMIGALIGRLDKPTLCLVKEVWHGKLLSELTGCPFVSGEDQESRDYIRQFNSGGITKLIGTTGVLGEGVDTKPAEYIIIAGGGKAKSQFMQAVGRGVRVYPGKESAKIILIKDKSHRFLLTHYKAQAIIMKEEYGVTPMEINL